MLHDHDKICLNFVIRKSEFLGERGMGGGGGREEGEVSTQFADVIFSFLS